MTVAFDQPIAGIKAGFADQFNPQARHLLPNQLRLAQDKSGAAAFSLLQHSPNLPGAGGILSATFQLWRNDDLPPTARPLAMRRKVILRAPSAAEEVLRDWTDMTPTQDGTLPLRVFLDPVEVQIMRDLATNAETLLKVQVDADFLVWRAAGRHATKEIITQRFEWNLSDAPEVTQNAAARARHFPSAATIEPFQDVAITVLNQIPLDPQSAVVLRCDLSFPGQDGRPVHQTVNFRSDGGLKEEIQTTFPALVQNFELEDKAQIVLVPSLDGGFPVVWPTGAAHKKAADPFNVDLSMERLDVTLTNIIAEPEVFEHCDEVIALVELHDYRLELLLTPSQHSVWCVTPGRTETPSFALSAKRGSLELALSPPTSGPGFVHVDQMDLLPTVPTTFHFETTNQIPFAVVELAIDGRRAQSKVLRPGNLITFETWPASIFDAPDATFTASVVRFDSDGATLPMETLPPAPISKGETLLIS